MAVARHNCIGIRRTLNTSLPGAEIERLAHESGAVRRRRKVDASAMLWTVLLGFGTGRKRTLAGARVDESMAGGKDLLSSPILVGVRALARQGVREIHLSIALLQILLMDHLHTYKVLFQGLYELLGERRDTVIVSLAVAHREGLHFQVRVPDPESEALPDAQARAVQKLHDELMHSGHQSGHASRLLTDQDDGYPGLPACAVCVDFAAQWLLEDMLVEEDERIHGLVLGGGGHIVTPPHKDAHFAKQSDRHTNSPGLGHSWNLVSRGVACLWTMELHMVDPPETGSNIALFRQIFLTISGYAEKTSDQT